MATPINHNGQAPAPQANDSEIIQHLRSLISREIMLSSTKYVTRAFLSIVCSFPSHPNPVQMEKQLRRTLALSLLEDALEVNITGELSRSLVLSRISDG